MENKKICPLMTIGEESYAFCMKEKCAWWDWFHSKCAVAVSERKKK